MISLNRPPQSRGETLGCGDITPENDMFLPGRLGILLVLVGGHFQLPLSIRDKAFLKICRA